VIAKTSILTRILLGACLRAAASGAAADLTGTWNTKFHAPDGIVSDGTLTLLQESDRLTGKLSSTHGSVELVDGAVHGQQVSFNVHRIGNGDDLMIHFTGAVKRDRIKLKMQYRDHPPVVMEAVKQH
jgi:hypothetical protein